jgi:hypothetical protein
MARAATGHPNRAQEHAMPITFPISLQDDDAALDAKAREARIRRAAVRIGLKLVKSRRRDPRAPDHGRYWLSEPIRNQVMLGGSDGVSLDLVEDFIGERKSAGW